jgi:hypothetical protein
MQRSTAGRRDRPRRLARTTASSPNCRHNRSSTHTSPSCNAASKVVLAALTGWLSVAKSGRSVSRNSPSITPSTSAAVSWSSRPSVAK